MQLVELLKDWPCHVKGSVRINVQSIADNSKDVVKNCMFIMHSGKHFKGESFIEEARDKGAHIFVTDNEQLYEQWNASETLVWVPNSRTFTAYAAHRFLGEPSNAIQIIAITGTNGKTTVSHFIGQLAQKIGLSVLVIGTNGVFVNGMKDNTVQDTLTTKSAITMHKLFKRAIDEGIDLVVLEASSMGLEMARLDYCAIDVGVFLNLSHEHLDDHETLEKYKLAKRKLIPLCDELLCNADDLFCQSVALKANQPKKLYSCKNKGNINLQVLHETEKDCLVKIILDDTQEVCYLPFAEPFMQSNACAAISALLMLGYPLNKLIEGTSKLVLPEGRMNKVTKDNGAQIIIDYAHTPEAFKRVLQHVSSYCKGKVITVFSCGGGRDPSKRQEMGRIASKYSDLIILTTDNCRNEDPNDINAQIKEGFFLTQVYKQILDRKKAIAYALQVAESEDVVCVLGKGHETQQIIGDTTFSFSDLEAVHHVLIGLHDEKEVSSDGLK